MQSLAFSLILSLLFASIANAQLCIRNVNLVDIENRKITEGADLVVIGNKITYAGTEARFKLAPGTPIIDGSGKYLIPGFTDAHVHFFQTGGIFARPDAINLTRFQPYKAEIKWAHDNFTSFLERYAMAGITSVIDVGSSFGFLAHRDTLRSRQRLPQVFMTGPLLTTYVPTAFDTLENESPFVQMVSESQVREAVQEQKQKHADFIKLWFIVGDSVEKDAQKNLPLVRAAIAEAHRLNLKVAVHATELVTARYAVEAGANFLVHSVDDQILSSEFIAMLKRKNVIVCPTLIVATNYGKVFSGNYRFNELELKLSHPRQVQTIRDFPAPDTVLGNRIINSLKNGHYFQRRKLADSIACLNLKRMADAGVIIATGTDAGNIGTQHAGSYFNELAAMHNAGMDLWQLLAASTVNGAKVLGKEKLWGRLQSGYIANMVLLSANPVANLDNWKKIEKVILNGVVMAYSF